MPPPYTRLAHGDKEEFAYGINHLPRCFEHPKDLAGRVITIGISYWRIIGVLVAGQVEDDDCKIDEFSLIGVRMLNPILWVDC